MARRAAAGPRAHQAGCTTSSTRWRTSTASVGWTPRARVRRPTRTNRSVTAGGPPHGPAGPPASREYAATYSIVWCGSGRLEPCKSFSVWVRGYWIAEEATRIWPLEARPAGPRRNARRRSLLRLCWPREGQPGGSSSEDHQHGQGKAYYCIMGSKSLAHWYQILRCDQGWRIDRKRARRREIFCDTLIDELETSD